VYTGQLFKWKGVEAILGAARRLPGVRFVVIGGTGEDLEAYRRKAAGLANVEAPGQVPPADVPLRTRAADVLLLPNSAKERISREHTSPLKLFEYMASGAPIVASDLPSLREVLDARTARLVAPDDEAELAKGVEWVLEHPVEARAMAEAAGEEVKGRTWEERARRILEFAARER
jgi:glycosyltransferase involved in cell wall biosynthesis